MKIIFTERARRDWRGLDRSTREQLRKKLSFYLGYEPPLRFAEKLRKPASGDYRFRIGDYRIVFDLVVDVIVILRVGHRKDIYR